MKPVKYKCIVVTKRGPPENLQITECDLRDPSAKEVRVKVLATCVCLPDVQNRYGLSPFASKVPFVPGYAIIGVVDAAGPGVKQVAPGVRVAAYLMVGGYAEYVYLRENLIIPVPPSLDPAEAVPLLLNYLTAYQALHRSAKVRAGDKVLIIGASGGCGTAFLDLGRLAKLTMYGIASKSKHPILVEYGATPIDYRTEDYVEVIRRAEPGGLDAVFDGMGGNYIDRAFPLLRRGGVLVEYGNPLSIRGTLRVLAKILVLNLLPNGRRFKSLTGQGLCSSTESRFWRTGLSSSGCCRRARFGRSSAASSHYSTRRGPMRSSKAVRSLGISCCWRRNC